VNLDFFIGLPSGPKSCQKSPVSVVYREGELTLERLFGEERRRSKTIPHAFGERAVLKLMYAALIRASDSWRGVKVTEFELRQIQALREDLQRAHAERIKPVVPIDSPSHPTKVSSRPGT
jgi:hypothetical protein